MTNFVFNGTTNQRIEFDPAADTLDLNVAPNQFSDIRQNGDNVQFITLAGAVLTLSDITLADLTNENVSVQGNGIFTVGDMQDGDDDDLIEGSDFGDVILGLTDNDIDAGDGDNVIFGGNSRVDKEDDGDTITSEGGDDLIYGNGGDDEITSGSGNDLVYGGKGADEINATPDSGERAMLFGGGDVVDLNADVDTITVGAEDDIADGAADVFGNAGDDFLNVYADGDNRVEGGRDDDTILVEGDGDNTVRGGRGEDTILVRGDGDNTVFGGNMSGSPDDVADRIAVAGDGNNEVYGNGGDDIIVVDGEDTSGANAGQQGDGSNQIFGGRGDDTILLANSGGDNRVEGNLGSDAILVGFETGEAIEIEDLENLESVNVDDLEDVDDGEGNLAQFLAIAVSAEGGLTGDNSIYGGNEASTPDDDGDLILAAFADGESEVYGNGGDDFIGIGANGDASVLVTGGQGDDTIGVGAAGDSMVTVEGNFGDDTIFVQTSGDATVMVTGGVGDDTIIAVLDGEGDDSTITGGIGDDTITVDGTGEGDVTINADGVNANEEDGDDTVNIVGAASYTVALGGGDDTLDGTDATGDIVADGGEGDDTLIGGDGDDELTGGAGDDVIFGGGVSSAPDGELVGILPLGGLTTLVQDILTLDIDLDTLNERTLELTFGDNSTVTVDIGNLLNLEEILADLLDLDLGGVIGGIGDLLTDITDPDGALLGDLVNQVVAALTSTLVGLIPGGEGTGVFGESSAQLIDGDLQITLPGDADGRILNLTLVPLDGEEIVLDISATPEFVSDAIDGDGFDLLVGGDGDDTLVGGAGSDVFGGGNGDDLIYLDDDVVDPDGDLNPNVGDVDGDAFAVNEVHFSTGLTGSDTIFGFDSNEGDKGSDFIAFLDGDGSDGSVEFAAGDNIEGAQGRAFNDSDVNESYFEFTVGEDGEDEGDFVYTNDNVDGDGTPEIGDADNSVVKLTVEDGVDFDIETVEIAGLADAYVVVEGDDGSVDIYFDDNWNNEGGRELVGTIDDTEIDELVFADFGVYGTGEDGTSEGTFVTDEDGLST